MSWGGLVLAGMAALAAVSATQIEHMGVPLFATAERITAFLAAPLTSPQEFFGMMVPLFILIYAGELVWREREARLSEITGAAPVPEWVYFLGKFVGLGLVLVALQALMMAAGMLIQVFLGHFDFQIGLYARILFGLQLPDYLLFALLALVVHALVNHKYVGHLVVVIAYGFMAFWPGDRESSTTCSSTGPILAGRTRTCAASNRSSGRGSGSSSTGPRGRCCWRWRRRCSGCAARRRTSARGSRWRAAASRVEPPGSPRAAVALILTLGGFIFYNTNVLNAYRTGLRWLALSRRI